MKLCLQSIAYFGQLNFMFCLNVSFQTIWLFDFVITIISNSIEFNPIRLNLGSFFYLYLD